MHRVFTAAYNLLMLFLSPLIALGFSVHPRGRIRIRERFGMWMLLEPKYVWFHAASLGEVQALIPLLKTFSRQFPAANILVTTTTSSGAATAERAGYAARLLPLDLSWLYRRAWGKAQPQALIISETEMWPNLIRYAGKRGVPIVQVNAVVSERAFEKYKLIDRLFRTLYGKYVKKVFVSDSESLTRLSQLGIESDLLQLNGNTKYERKAATIDRADEAGSSSLKTVALMSFHPAEVPVLEKVLEASQEGQRFRVIVAPRHEERFKLFSELLKSRGLSFGKRSEGDTLSATHPLLLLDTLGEGEHFSALADVVVLGGTFFPLGGHNPLEPAAHRVPIVFGTHRSKISSVSDELLLAGGAYEAANGEGVVAHLDSLLGSEELRRKAGSSAHKVWLGHQGASERVVRYCTEDLGFKELLQNG